MKKLLAAVLAAGLVLSLSACMGAEEVPETEETLPLPLWAQEESERPAESKAETEEMTFPTLPEEETQETISQRPEKHPQASESTEATEAQEAVKVPETEKETKAPAETEETEAPQVTSAYEMEEKFQAVPERTVYALKSVNIRTQGNVNSPSLGRLGEGKAVTQIGVSDDGWTAVIYEEEVCYISSEYLTVEEHPEPPENPNLPQEQEVDDMVYTVDDVNMREGPGFDRAILCRVPEFVELHRTGIVTSGWSKVTWKDKEGYISTGYLAEKHPGESQSESVEEEETDDTVYTTREVNLRKGPGTNKAIIGRIPQGTELQRIAIADNGWGKVIYEGKEGYVSGDYLSTEIPADG